MIYFNLLIAVSDWTVRSTVPVWAGVSGVHVVALGVVLAGLRVRLGIRWRGWAAQ